MTDGNYDCAVAFSGGKDSALLLWESKRAGKRPLAITVDTGFLSPCGLRNLVAVPARLGVDHLTIRPAPAVFARLYRQMVPTIPHDPFAMCAVCHQKIADLTSAFAPGCPIMDGFAPGEEVLIPDSVAVMQAKTGHEYPLVARRNYDLMAVRELLASHGILSMRNSDPLRTNCVLNLVIVHDYYAEHGTNPYAEFFLRSGDRMTLSRMNRVLWFGWHSGYLSWAAKRIMARIERLAQEGIA